MKMLYEWLIKSDVQLTARKKTRGFVTIQRTDDGKGLVIEADDPNPVEQQAIVAAQRELERDQNGDSLTVALQILEPYTNGIFLVAPRGEA